MLRVRTGALATLVVAWCVSDRFHAPLNSVTGQECYCEHSYQTLGQQTKNSSYNGCFDVGGEDKGASNTGGGLVCE